MTSVESGLVDRRRESNGVKHVNKMRYMGKVMKKKRCIERIRRPLLPAIPQALQQLFLACRDVFKGPGTVPLPCDVQKLCDILDNMRPEDVGLSSKLPFFKATDTVKGTPRVTYTTMYQCQEFSICIFFLPATAVIPLHNHPGMTVFSKLLLGKMHIKSYDWVDASSSDNYSQLRQARLKADSDFTAPCNTSVLYPTTGGNIHEFTAITPCAVLDVLGPPYSQEDGRDSSYYRDFPYSAFSNGETNTVRKEEGDCYGWLEEVEMPENSKMDRIEYLGPQITDQTTGF